MKPHCHCDQLTGCEGLQKRQEHGEDYVEEGEGGHCPCREVVRSPDGAHAAVDEPRVGHRDCQNGPPPVDS